jgi:hypothetical protein
LAYVPIKTEELKKLVMMGKRRPMNFAYNPGPKEADLLIIDRIKAPEVLSRIAKKEGDGTKVAFGTFELEGKKLTLKVPKELPGLAKKIRKYLKKLDFSFSILIQDPKGNTLESDLSEDDQTDTKEQASAPPQEARPEPPQQAENVQIEDNDANAEAAAQDTKNERDALAGRLRALQAPIGELGPVGIPLKKAAAVVVAQLKAGSLDQAEATLSKIEAGMAKIQAKAAEPKDTNESAESNSNSEAKTAPDPKALVARAGSVKQLIGQLQDVETGPAKKQLIQALADLKAKDWEAAATNLSAAENSLNAVSAAKAQEQNDDVNTENKEPDATSAVSKSQQKWEAMADQLQAKVDAAMVAKRGDPDAISRAFNYAKSQAEAGEFDSAVAAATNTVKLLKEAAKAPADAPNARVQEAADSAPDNVVAYTQSRLKWIDTRNGLQTELIKLKMAIEVQTRGVEGLEEIAQNASVLLDYLEEIDTSLEASLEELVKTPDGPQREKLKDEATKIIGTYRTTLDTDFFKSVDDNGFTNTSIRSTALNALTEVETALAA